MSLRAILLCILLAVPVADSGVPSLAQADFGPKAASVPAADTKWDSGLPPAATVNVTGAYSKEPAPMGVADYGVGPEGAYQYATNSSLGIADIRSLSTRNATGDPWASVQLNVVLQFATNGKTHVYWVQDVVQIDTSRNYVRFLDNVWNASARKANMSLGAISGGGTVDKAQGRAFYYKRVTSLPGDSVNLKYPATIKLQVNTTTNSVGQPAVSFSYNDGYGSQIYDVVAFRTTGKLSLPGFVVNGFTYTPGSPGYYDSEIVIAGACCSQATIVRSADVRLQLEFWNGHNYQLVTNGRNSGSDTAETISNAQVEGYYYFGGGSLVARLTDGAGTLGYAWSTATASAVDIKSPLASGTLVVKNATDPNAVPARYPFVNGEVRVVMYPGYFDLQIYQGNTLYSAGKFNIKIGQSLQLRTPLSGILVGFAYSVVGGGAGYSPPTISYVLDGTRQNSTLVAQQTTLYLDANSTWSFTPVLVGSTTSERWLAGQPISGTAANGQNITVTYYHQFFISVQASPNEGGSVSAINDWYTQGSTLRISSTANPGWSFHGWQGTGKGAYSGPNASASLSVGGALTETGVFYAGLTIDSASGGVVTYTFEESGGTVGGGTSYVLYVPAGSNVSLRAEPSSPLEVFTGWGGGISTSAPQTAVSVASPMEVRAGFGLNYTLIVLALFGVMAPVVAITLWKVMGRKPSASTTPGPFESVQGFQPRPGFCSVCGAEIDPQEFYCTNCGAKIT